MIEKVWVTRDPQSGQATAHVQFAGDETEGEHKLASDPEGYQGETLLDGLNTLADVVAENL